MKIGIITISLSGGGAERSTALLSKMLVSEGFDVHLITLTDRIRYDHAGTLFNLGKYKAPGDTWWKKAGHLRRLRSYIKRQNFDFIIDNRARNVAFKELVYLKYIYQGQRLIYAVHSFKWDQYFTSSRFIASLMGKKAVLFVCVSKAIAKNVNATLGFDKASCIYNSVPENRGDERDTSDSKYIIYLGRIEEKVKNFGLLLQGYRFSGLPEAGIALKIFGDGDDKDWLRDQIDKTSLSGHVRLHPFDPDIFSELSGARFLVLTSRHEGFPMVLPEALSVGTPVVSVNCKSGPDEVIVYGQNGLLVENHNSQVLAEAMTRMVEDKSLYQTCKQNARKSVSHLSPDVIARQWAESLRGLNSGA